MSILDYTAEEHKQWVSSLSNEDIANILNIVASIPNYKKQTESDIAAVKGKAGENKFESIFEKHMPSDYELSNVAKKGKAGDFIVKWTSPKTNKLYKVLIDVKNYKNTVPSLEVDKFHRDVNLNNVNGGLLLSLNSRIVGTNKIIEFKNLMTDNGLVSLILLNNNTPSVIAEIIKLLFHVIEIKDYYKSDLCKSNELVYSINQLSDSIQTITACRDILQTSKSDIEKSLNTIMVKLIACEQELISKIKQIGVLLI